MTPRVHMHGEKSEKSEKSLPLSALNSLNSLHSHVQCAHTRTGENGGQPVCLDCGKLLPHPTPSFDELTVRALWCSTCGVTVSFRTLTQLDGTDVYLCNTCDPEVGQKHAAAPASNAGTHAPNDVLLKGQTAPPVASSDNMEEF
jgi:hypothetical protein